MEEIKAEQKTLRNVSIKFNTDSPEKYCEVQIYNGNTHEKFYAKMENSNNRMNFMELEIEKVLEKSYGHISGAFFTLENLANNPIVILQDKLKESKISLNEEKFKYKTLNEIWENLFKKAIKGDYSCNREDY